MLGLQKIYCRFPVPSVSSTNDDYCGGPVTEEANLGPVLVCLCTEHARLISHDRKEMDKLISSISKSMVDSASRYFEIIEELNGPRD